MPYDSNVKGKEIKYAFYKLHGERIMESVPVCQSTSLNL
jgi:hypothetical protein